MVDMPLNQSKPNQTKQKTKKTRRNYTVYILIKEKSKHFIHSTKTEKLDNFSLMFQMEGRSLSISPHTYVLGMTL